MPPRLAPPPSCLSCRCRSRLHWHYEFRLLSRQSAPAQSSLDPIQLDLSFLPFNLSFFPFPIEAAHSAPGRLFLPRIAGPLSYLHLNAASANVWPRTLPAPIASKDPPPATVTPFCRNLCASTSSLTTTSIILTATTPVCTYGSCSLSVLQATSRHLTGLISKTPRPQPAKATRQLHPWYSTNFLASDLHGQQKVSQASLDEPPVHAPPPALSHSQFSAGLRVPNCQALHRLLLHSDHSTAASG